MNPSDANKAAAAPNVESPRPTDGDSSSAAVNRETHGISPQDPDSMPRDDDNPEGVPNSPEFTDRPGQGSPSRR
jgi:hypothetical protein